MKIGYIGLGKMGSNMTLRLLEKGYDVVATDPDQDARHVVAQAGAEIAVDLDAMITQLPVPRVVWVMVPSGEISDTVINELAQKCDSGDTIINGGNEFFEDTVRHGQQLATRGMHLIDAGVSGGQDGARNGACMMIGGTRDVFERNEGLFRDLTAEGAYQFFPGVGAGHFVKMVHNGIEYGMMQAIAEGFDVLRQSEFSLDLKDAARIYNRESIVASRLVGWLEEGFAQYGVNLTDVSGSAGSGGNAGMNQSEAKWTMDVAHNLGIAVPVIRESINVRLASQKTPTFQAQIINVLRNMFGGHSSKK